MVNENGRVICVSCRGTRVGVTKVECGTSEGAIHKITNGSVRTQVNKNDNDGFVTLTVWCFDCKSATTIDFRELSDVIGVQLEVGAIIVGKELGELT